MLRRYEKRYEHRKMKALEPQERFCALIKKRMCILVEYQDYKSSHYKGEMGTIYCENIIECYHKNMRCCYSGISPSYPDPLVPLEDMHKYLQEDESAGESGCSSPGIL
ncbi:MAG: hypothetical protein AB2L14_21030 [Candidatus Xenobiia bacterium LiM19]